MAGLFGSKPQVPTLPTINLGDEAAKATAANQKNLTGSEALVGKANQFSMDQITSMLEQSVPGYSNMVKSLTGNIASELKGEIPADVQAQIENSTAGQALGRGYGGSGAHGNLVARDLGLTSLNLTQQGLSSMENWTKTAASLYEPSMMNVQSMFISPMQQYQTDNEQNVQQFQRQWMENQVKAQPDMAAQAFKEAVEATLSAYSGSSYQHAGTLPVQGGVGGGMGGGYPYSPGAGEGGAGFDPYSTQFNDTSTGMSDFSAGGGMDNLGGGGFGGFV